ncbi:MAG: AlpA family phage regulatory protein [Burkholderiales bacterium]
MHLVQETRRQVVPDRFMRLPEVEATTGLKKSTLYLLMKRGEFPHSVQITPRCIAWHQSLVLGWLKEKGEAAAKSASDAKQSPAASAGGSAK